MKLLDKELGEVTDSGGSIVLMYEPGGRSSENTIGLSAEYNNRNYYLGFTVYCNSILLYMQKSYKIWKI